MNQRPIEDYALLGDLHTAALVSREGAVEWLCLPRFDSPACFAALLHDDRAGVWQLGPAEGGPATRRGYVGDSLILASEWETDEGAVRVLDFMPPRDGAADLVRIVEGLRGRVPMRTCLRPRFDYGSVRPWVRNVDGRFDAVAGPDAVWLTTPVEVSTEGIAEFTVAEGERVPFVLTYHASYKERPDPADAEKALEHTEQFWAEWIGRCRYDGRWPVAVRRALITLKALTYEPTGGILAAPTTSLPEQLGGERNWDYRYCWLRDATFTLQALVGTGYPDEARAWREWLVRAAAGDPAELQVLYGLDGSRRVPESTVDWLDGYAGSTPVRIGNAAAGQIQLDVWGEALDGLHLVREAGLPVTHSAWDLQRGLLDFLEGHWDQPDRSLWEVRGEPQHFVHSKVMAWAGIDRAVRTVERHRLDGPVDRWRALRDRIHEEVCREGFDADRNTFTQFYGSRGLDAALLLIPRVGFLPGSDPRVRGTVDAVRKELSHDGFVHRFDPEADPGPGGLHGGEGAFLPCSFWLADALHGTGRTEEATEVFERMLGVRNDVGLLSEEYDVAAGRQLGNMPQAFSMVGLVNTARHLDGAETTTNATGRQQGLRHDV
ncbi:glycoside hydrolase family 15 protein [Amycolatopsis echigonensis]|uniref:Trehalase n=1 Tax=Amycolatopsis echigonensis TaxID=2576905 RepID=A0A2N3WS89_9PSEU|nr:MULTISPECIES: glycoside hydrolase family 15 protein [Amycolatopsis]MBB2502443.1 glycoside hydrolase family 15 protein [Amycolatopsis echigonensis]PKV96748.1 GH15 family glucan-1,4-alpha-glucosidase [Amycolatopsis niigatensis]